MKPRVSIVITAYNEADNIDACLDRVFESVDLPCEVLVVFDSPDDTTIPFLEKYSAHEPRLVPLLNELGPGPARAIRAGIAATSADVVVVTMADGCDDAEQIDILAKLVERGVVIAAASRYARTGQQVGGPFMKGFLSRMAGLSLFWFARVGTGMRRTPSRRTPRRSSSPSASTPMMGSRSVSSWWRRRSVFVFRWPRCRPSGLIARSACRISSL
jgi:dolichol-phosphate mannosyltransferase